ncbi:MAG: hypothetical protein MPJ50_07555 [Pirellulales bacterium]|nr:hypothetical protein [Pirellulales bacterium]
MFLTRRLSCVASIVVIAAIALVLAPALQAQQTGNFSGRFVYDGNAPERVEIIPTKDQAAFTKKIWEESLIVGKSGGIANVVVYVTSKDVPVPDALPAGTLQRVTLDNQGGAFVPHVLPFWMGKQEFVATNTDAVAHNCNCASIGDRTGTFNQQLTPGQQYIAKFTREQRTLQPVSCNIHPWMKAYVLPRKNPYFAVTDEDGHFTIENIPVGEWQFQVIHEESGYMAINDWERGRFMFTIKPGENSLGEDVHVPPSIFEK